MSGSSPDGVLVVDKPLGPTSHDVVATVRRALHTKRVGHAGTLDPMATGVLVVLVGEATKLAPYLTASDKRYAARVTFGTATDSYDAAGTVVTSAPVPSWLTDELAAAARGDACPRLDAALLSERARTQQVPPSFSAVSVGGVRSHAEARAGRMLELAPRDVSVRSLRVVASDASAGALDLELEVSKGYYVRSLAHDLGRSVGVPAHLGALRRTASGPFDIGRAVTLAEVQGAVLEPVASAVARVLSIGRLSDQGAGGVRAGRVPLASDFQVMPALGVPSAWLDGHGSLVAIGELSEAASKILRGFTADTSGLT